MYCQNCGSEIPKDGMYCQNCGAKVELEDVNPTAIETRVERLSKEIGSEIQEGDHIKGTTAKGVIGEKNKLKIFRRKKFWLLASTIVIIVIVFALFLHAENVKQQKIDWLQTALAEHHDIITSGQTLAECWSNMCNDVGNSNYYWNDCRNRIYTPNEMRQRQQDVAVALLDFEEEDKEILKPVTSALASELSAYEEFYNAVGDLDMNWIEKIFAVKLCSANLLEKSTATLARIGEATEKITGESVPTGLEDENMSAIEKEATRDTDAFNENSYNGNYNAGGSELYAPSANEGSDSLLNYYGKNIDQLMQVDKSIVPNETQYEYGLYRAHKGETLYFGAGNYDHVVCYLECTDSGYSVLGLRVGDSEQKMLDILGNYIENETNGGYWFSTNKEYEFRDVTSEIYEMHVGINASGRIELIVLGCPDE